MKYVLLPLLATGAPCLINIDTIATAYEDTNRDKQRGLKIYTTDGDYTFVDCTLNGLLKRIDCTLYEYPDEEDEDDDISDPPWYGCEGFCKGCEHIPYCPRYTEGGETFDDDLSSIDKGTGMITGGGPDE